MQPKQWLLLVRPPTSRVRFAAFSLLSSFHRRWPTGGSTSPNESVRCTSRHRQSVGADGPLLGPPSGAHGPSSASLLNSLTPSSARPPLPRRRQVKRTPPRGPLRELRRSTFSRHFGCWK